MFILDVCFVGVIVFLWICLVCNGVVFSGGLSLNCKLVVVVAFGFVFGVGVALLVLFVLLLNLFILVWCFCLLHLYLIVAVCNQSFFVGLLLT